MDETADLPAPSDAQFDSWIEQFKHYRAPPTRLDIENWIDQFKPEDSALAQRVLDHILVISDTDTLIGYRDALNDLPSWSINSNQRVGNWYFVGCGVLGESGPQMSRLFREANRLNSPAHDACFVTFRELPRLKLTANDTVVFIDDIAGSGAQITKFWPTIEELVASEADCRLVLTVLTERARDRIERDTDLIISCAKFLGPEYDLFDNRFVHFTADEKNTILSYCTKADGTHPKGWGDCGLLLSMSHKTPNNTIPIISAHNDNWAGILPRYTPLPV
jgi:hypothetical protein